MTQRSFKTHASVLSALAGLAAVLPTAAAQFAEPVVGQIDRGVYRFDISEEARDETVPSFSFENPGARETFRDARRGPALDPVFLIDDDGSQVVQIDVEDGTNLYGTGEIGGELERSGRRTVAWNTDAYGYDENRESLYQSHPWVLAVRADGSAYGVLADTTYRCTIDLTNGIMFSAQGPAYPVIVFEGDSPQQVIERLTEYIGRIEMPPKWAIGYHQCRYSYYPDTQAQEIARNFRERNIPADVIWHDIHYMDDYLVFTFDPERYPNPSEHNAVLHGMNFKTVWMIDPGVGIRDGYDVYEELKDQDLAVLNAEGEQFVGEVWPGPCLFPDYTMEETREWWAGLYPDFMATGIDGVWNDMNEPAVFDGPGHTMPLDNWHRADEELGGPASHRRFHNVYGMLMAHASREGILDANPDKRPFVLTRASFIGGHRDAATWTGDNVATWDHVDMTIPMILNLGLSGQPFSGPDIGGFAEDGDAQQFGRWMGFGALLPFSRGHTSVDSRQKEPWAYGPEVEEISRLSLRRRYELMPLFYTLFHEAHSTGLPVMRPLFFADPTDPALREHDDSFLLGDDLMVFSQVRPEAARSPVFPDGIWRPVRLEGDRHPELPEMFIRGGGIVPAGPDIQYVDEKPLDPLTLIVSLDEEGRASGTLYEDAGEGWAFRDGEFLLSTYEARRRGDGRVIVDLAGSEGDMARPDREVVVRLITDHGEYIARGVDGEEIEIDLPSDHVIAHDDAHNDAYGFGWIGGSDGGDGFGPWRFASDTEAGDGWAGRFLANRMNADLEHTASGAQATGFGLFANKGQGREHVVAERDVDEPLNREGRVFEIDIEPGLVGDNGSIGLVLAAADEDRSTDRSATSVAAEDPMQDARIALTFNGGDQHFTLHADGRDRRTNIPYTPYGLRVQIVFSGEDSADLFAYRFDGPTTADGRLFAFGTVPLAGSGDVETLRLFSTDGRGESGSNGDFFANRLRVYDRIDAADASDAEGPIDVNDDGKIDDLDAIEFHRLRLDPA